MDVDDDRASALWSYAIALGASREDATDAVQEAFTRFAERTRAGAIIQNSDGWLYSTVHHIVVDQVRWRGRVKHIIARLSSMRESHAFQEPPSIGDDDVWDAVDALPAQQRAAIHLRYRADLDFRSISDIMGVSEGAARSYVPKALDRLEASLSDGGKEER
jgi:RNA polymerase sigma-70 factor (ECF subfamily)